MVRRFGKRLLTFFTTVAAVLVSSPVVFAAEAIPAGESYVKVIFSVGAMVGAAGYSHIKALAARTGVGVGGKMRPLA